MTQQRYKWQTIKTKVIYVLTYANAGPDDGTGVIINEVVPANTTFNQAESAPTT